MILNHCGTTSEIAVGPLFIRKVHLTATTPDVAPHVHPFSHITFFMGGQIAVTLTNADGTTKTVQCGAGDFLEIPAGITHSMHLVSAEAVCSCVFANRDANGALQETFESPAATL